MLAQLIAIIILVLLLCCKNRFHNIFDSNPKSEKKKETSNSEPELRRNFTSQTSQEMTSIKVCNLPEKAKSTFHESASNGSINNIISQTYKPSAKTTDGERNIGLTNSNKMLRSIKTELDQKMMKKICEDALAKAQNSGNSASLRDLQNLLQHEETPASMEIKSKIDSIRFNKSSSFPELDVYETNPSNVPVDLVTEAVYDCLPSPGSKNIIVEDRDTKYLLALSTESFQEPAYINARCNLARPQISYHGSFQ